MYLNITQIESALHSYIPFSLIISLSVSLSLSLSTRYLCMYMYWNTKNFSAAENI